MNLQLGDLVICAFISFLKYLMSWVLVLENGEAHSCNSCLSSWLQLTIPPPAEGICGLGVTDQDCWESWHFSAVVSVLLSWTHSFLFFPQLFYLLWVLIELLGGILPARRAQILSCSHQKEQPDCFLITRTLEGLSSTNHY